MVARVFFVKLGRLTGLTGLARLTRLTRLVRLVKVADRSQCPMVAILHL